MGVSTSKFPELFAHNGHPIVNEEPGIQSHASGDGEHSDPTKNSDAQCDPPHTVAQDSAGTSMEPDVNAQDNVVTTESSDAHDGGPSEGPLHVTLAVPANTADATNEQHQKRATAGAPQDPSHHASDVLYVEESMKRAAAMDDVGSSPRLSPARYALVTELQEAGFTGIEVLRTTGALEELASRASGAESRAVALQQTNALSDSYVRDALVTADVITCGALSRRWSRVGDMRVQYRSRDGAVLKTDFHGSPYVAYLAQRRLTLIAFVLVACLVIFIVVVVATPSFAAFLYNELPPTMELIGELAIGIAIIVILMVTYLNSVRKARSLSGMLSSGKGSLPTLLPVLLEPTVPRFMVSYSWIGPLKTTARTLARVLPDCWLDTRQLVSPEDIPHATTSVATHCSCLVLLLTPSYLASPNCCAEIVTTALLRSPVRHITVALMAIGGRDGFHAADAERIMMLLARLGVPAVVSVPQLLYHLDVHVLRVSTPIALARTVAWWRHYSRPRPRVETGLQLMSPQQRRTGRVYSLVGPRVFGTGSVVAGTDHLSGDCATTGRIMRVTGQQKAAILVIVLLGMLFAYPFVVAAIGAPGSLSTSCLAPPTGPPGQTNWDHKCSPYLWGPTIGLLIIALSAFQMISGLDARALHDPVLLPLNVAAYINEDAGTAELLGAFTIVVLRPPNLTPRAACMVSSLQRFLQDIAVGVPCREESLTDFTNHVVTTCKHHVADIEAAEAAVTRAAAALGASSPRRLKSDVSASSASPSSITSRVNDYFKPGSGTTTLPRAGDNETPEAIALTKAITVLHQRRVAAAAPAGGGARPLTIYLWMLDEDSVHSWAEAVRADAARMEASGTHGVAVAPGSTAPGTLLSQSVLVTDRSVFGVTTSPPLGRHLCLVFGDKEGIDEDSPYPSMAKAVLDSLGRKVGPVLAAGSGAGAEADVELSELASDATQ